MNIGVVALLQYYSLEIDIAVPISMLKLVSHRDFGVQCWSCDSISDGEAGGRRGSEARREEGDDKGEEEAGGEEIMDEGREKGKMSEEEGGGTSKGSRSTKEDQIGG